jgi:enoyl-CoA hydratase
MIKPPSFETVIYSTNDGVAEIRFNRPHRLNAVIEQLYLDALAAIEQAERNPDVRVVVLTGEGRAFCVGADLKEHGKGERSPLAQREYLLLGNEICRRIYTSSKPVIAAVNGYALGAGAEISVSSDFILMKESAQLGFPEVSIGTFVGGGITHILPRLVGLAKARDLIVSGRRIDGREAVAIGLATQAFGDDGFEAGVEDFARRLAAKAPFSLRFAKAHLNDGGRSYEASLVTELEALRACMVTQDWKEGIAAFAEKRKPVFKGH